MKSDINSRQKSSLVEAVENPWLSGDPESYKAGKTSVAALGVHKPEMTQIFKKFWGFLFSQLNIFITQIAVENMPNFLYFYAHIIFGIQKLTEKLRWFLPQI